MKEFDIFLNKRLTECDLIVYNIPYRDGLTVMDRMILECCLEAYMLHKFLAVQTGSELISRIDKMVKTCWERLGLEVEPSAEAEFSSVSYVSPISSTIDGRVDPVALFAETYEKVLTEVQIAVEPVKLLLKKYSETNGSDTVPQVEIYKTLKRNIERFEGAVQIGAGVEESAKHVFEHAVAEAEIGAEMVNLLSRVYGSAETMTAIAATLKDIKIEHVLGRVRADVFADAEIGLGVESQKFLAIEQNLRILAEVTEIALKYCELEKNALTCYVEAGAVLRRLRKLAEVDPYDLTSIDNMPIGDLDYVVLEE